MADVEILKVIRKTPLGKLAVEINSIRYESLEEVRAANVKQTILAAVGDLIVFVDGYDTLVQAGLAPPASGSMASGQPLPPSISEREAAFRTELSRQRLEAELAAQAEPEPVKKEPPPELDDGPDVEINLVARIDALFQKYLAADPALQGRSAQLESDPGGGLKIRVDDTFYSQPKDIADPNVRRALMLALREWEGTK
jgi:hypothetical protein